MTCAPIYRCLPSVLLLSVVCIVSAGCTSELSESPKQSPAAKSESRINLRYVVGRRAVYHVEYSNQSETDFQPLFGKGEQTDGAASRPPGFSVSNAFQLKLQAVVSATTTARVNQVVRQIYRFERIDELQVLVDGKVPRDGLCERLRRDLARPFVVERDGSGKVVGVQLASGTDLLAASFVRSWLAATQCVVPDSPSATDTSWESREDDPNGVYLASYQRLPRAGGVGKQDVVALQKTRVRFVAQLESRDDGSERVRTKILPSGRIDMEFDAKRGLVVTLRGSESQDVQVAGRGVAKATTQLAMTLSETARLAPSRLAELSRLAADEEQWMPAGRLTVDPFAEQMVARTYAHTLGGERLVDLLARLNHLEASGIRDQQAENALYLKLRALIYLQPASCGALVHRIITAPSGSAALRIIPDALAAVGHDDAQAALVAAVTDARASDEARVAVIDAMGSVGQPSTETIDTLKRLARRSDEPVLARAALLELGNAARRLSGRHPSRAAAIAEELSAALARHPPPEQTRRLILALGNIGSEKALPVARDFLRNEDPRLRGAAAYALRWVEPDEAESLLLDSLADDADAGVRLQAARALKQRRVTAALLEKYVDAYRNEADEDVRAALVELLWQGRQLSSQVRPLLENTARGDPSKQVRRKADELLQQDADR